MTIRSSVTKIWPCLMDSIVVFPLEGFPREKRERIFELLLLFFKCLKLVRTEYSLLSKTIFIRLKHTTDAQLGSGRRVICVKSLIQRPELFHFISFNISLSRHPRYRARECSARQNTQEGMHHRRLKLCSQTLFVFSDKHFSDSPRPRYPFVASQPFFPSIIIKRKISKLQPTFQNVGCAREGSNATGAVTSGLHNFLREKRR